METAGYLDRLRQKARDHQWQAVLSQVGDSFWWRLSPTHRAMRAVMRENAAFDVQHGTDTGGEVPLEQLGIDADEARHGNGVYRAIPSSHFHAALSLLDLRLADYTFVDYGSGKGKALMLAREYPFRAIVGVEYSRVLHETACANLGREPQYGRVTALLADARDYLPPAGPLVCFFFNPFDAPTWRDVLARLQASFAATPRPIHLVYVNVRNVHELEDIFPEFTVFVPGAATRTVRILSALPEAISAAARSAAADSRSP